MGHFLKEKAFIMGAGGAEGLVCLCVDAFSLNQCVCLCGCERVSAFVPRV